MTWCSEVLARRTTALFELYCEEDFEWSDIPEDYKAEGPEWEAITNPDVNARFHFEFLSDPSPW